MRTIYEEVNAGETFWPRQEGNDRFGAEVVQGTVPSAKQPSAEALFSEQCKRSLLYFISFIVFWNTDNKKYIGIALPIERLSVSPKFLLNEPYLWEHSLHDLCFVSLWYRRAANSFLVSLKANS